VYDARTPSEATGAPAVAQFSAAGRETNKSRDAIYTVHTLVGETPFRKRSSKFGISRCQGKLFRGWFVGHPPIERGRERTR
jgi:hypothetical protein